jgi:hypothetical protein
MADGVPCRNTRETLMSKHEEKLERKSPAKPEIRKGSGALDDQDLEKVTGGDKKVTGRDKGVTETLTLSFTELKWAYTE